MTIIYHSADFDGKYSAAVAARFFPNARLVGWDFGDPPVKVTDKGLIVIVDLPPDEPLGLPRGGPIPEDIKQRLSWVDHHATSIAAYGDTLSGFQLEGVAACRLLYQIACYGERPTLQEFRDRKVGERMALTLAGEFDIWDHRDPSVLRFQAGLMALDPPISELLDIDVEATMKVGDILTGYLDRVAAENAKRAHVTEWKGHKWHCLNSSTKGSLQLKSLPRDGISGCIIWRAAGDKAHVSLYAYADDLHVGEIAKEFGGGGHRGAAGFTTGLMSATFISLP